MNERTYFFIAGLPRSGSDLLRDIIAQRPDSHSTTNESLCDRMYGQQHMLWSGSREILSDLHHDEPGTQRWMLDVSRAILDARYREHEVPFIFDKGRGWINHHDALAHTHPRSKIIVTVRHPLNCAASLHNLHMRFPILSDAPGGLPNEPFMDKLRRWFDPIGDPRTGRPPGQIGANLVRIEDKVLCGPKRFPNIVFVRFEDLVHQPKKTMRQLYVDLDIPDYEHDFDNVEAKATDLDALHRGKVIHRRESGPIKPPDTTWHDIVPPILAQEFAQRYQYTFSKFEYGPAGAGRPNAVLRGGRSVTSRGEN